MVIGYFGVAGSGGLDTARTMGGWGVWNFGKG